MPHNSHFIHMKCDNIVIPITHSGWALRYESLEVEIFVQTERTLLLVVPFPSIFTHFFCVFILVASK